MKVLKENSEIERRFQQIEQLMDELELHIDFNGINSILTDKKNNREYLLVDIEGPSRDSVLSLPRSIESERIIISED